ncbi:MAG TPA: ABC transporter ATP-binding protein [Candidatus Deferrimicrobiaceae bacterium]
MSAQETVIETAGLTKVFPTGFWRRPATVLHGLSFSVRRNEIVGFLGPNGAGKTTTIKILNGLAFPTTGTVKVFGLPVGRNTAFRRRIGFMPEQPYFYDYLTGEEFLRLCGGLCGIGGRETEARTRSILDRVGLAGAGKTAIRKYSKGMMQRLGLAQALLHDPELVVLDEPMSGLDPMGRVEVRTLIQELRAAGKTVFFSSHIITDVEALCDRVLLVNRGRLVAEGSVDGLVGGEGLRYVELLFSPAPPPEKLAPLGIPPEAIGHQGNLLVLKARSHEEGNAWLTAVTGLGAVLRSYQPVKRRLEDIYVERVGGEADGGR